MNEREAMARRIYAVEFACWELHLFLDTHPGNCDAARKLEEYQARAKKLRREFEEKYGLIGETPQDASRWAWIRDPWPWEPCPTEEEAD